VEVAGGDGCAALCMGSRPLSWALKMVTIGNLMMYIFTTGKTKWAVVFLF
jgi:hypothetical protein